MSDKKQDGPIYFPEVDALLGESEGDFSENQFQAHWSETGATSRVPRKDRAPRKKKKSKRWIPIVLVLLLVLIVGGAVVIAEPWVPAVKDTFVTRPTVELEPVTLAVGDKHSVTVELGDNEKIASIEAADPDILTVDGETVTAQGEYFETVLTVTTSEKELPSSQPAHQIVLFGKDFSAQHESVRRWLRNLLGIEKTEDIPTAVRTVAVYTQKFTVKGLDNVTDSPAHEIEACLQNSVVLELALNEKETVLVSAPGSAAEVKVIAESDGRAWLNVKGLEVAKTTVKATVGVWKTVSDEVFAQYSATVGAVVDEAHPKQIFVPHRAVNYTISVADLTKTEVATELESDDIVEVYSLETGYNDAIMKEVLVLVNAYRKEAGLAELTWSDALADAAKTRAQELSGKYGHLRPDGSSGLSASSAAKIEFVGCGYASAQGVFAAWCSESALRDQLLSPECTQFGGAFYRVEDGTYNNYQCGLLG